MYKFEYFKLILQDVIELKCTDICFSLESYKRKNLESEPRMLEAKHANGKGKRQDCDLRHNDAIR